MELYQLEELLALGKHGTISKAAEAIGVSQPAMSRALRLLENDIGVPIFHRTNNTIELTEAGKLAVAYALSGCVSILNCPKYVPVIVTSWSAPPTYNVTS